MGRDGNGWTVAVLALAVVGVAAFGACSTADPESADRLRPIDGGRVTAGPAPGVTVTTTSPDATAPPSEPTAATDAPTSDAAADPNRAVVDDLLARYDRALTDLAAEPAAVSQLGHPVLAAWLAVVTPGTALAEDLPAAITTRHAGGVVIRPTTDGISYRHRALEVIPAPDGSLSFTWCAWSPGIGYDSATGAVVDDAVGHAHGTGHIHAADGTWRLDSLDESDLRALPAGTPDPCPAEVAGSIGQTGRAR